MKKGIAMICLSKIIDKHHILSPIIDKHNQYTRIDNVHTVSTYRITIITSDRSTSFEPFRSP